MVARLFSQRKIFLGAVFGLALGPLASAQDYFSNLTVEDATLTREVEFASELKGVGPHLIEIDSHPFFGTNVTLRAHYFKAQNPQALVLAFHGFQSNGRWFNRTGKYLAERGISLLVYDRRGSGLSDGPVPRISKLFGIRKDFDPNPEEIKVAKGLRGHVTTGLILRRLVLNAPREFEADARAAYKKLLQLNRNLTNGQGEDLDVYVLANCFGARIAIPFVADRQDKIKGLFITAPSTDMRPAADIDGLFRKADVATPLLHVLNSADYISSPLKDNYFVSEGNPAYRGIADNRVSLSLRYGTGDFFWATRSLNKKMMKAIPKLKTPLLIGLGSRDQMVYNDRIIQRFAGGTDRKAKADATQAYPGPGKILSFDAEHMLEFSEAGRGFSEAIRRWIEADQRQLDPRQISLRGLPALQANRTRSWAARSSGPEPATRQVSPRGR